MGVLRRSLTDPCMVFEQGAWWLAFNTAQGAATLRLHNEASEVRASAFGPGAEAALETLPALLGELDDWSEFDSETFQRALPPLVREARRRNPGLRLPATGRVIDALVPAILEQKVTGKEAFRGYRALISWHGNPAPGPAPKALRLAPIVGTWATIPSWDWHRAGVGPQRSDTVMRALQRSSGLQRLGQLSADQASAGLQSIPGIGPWTAAEVVQHSHGDPDSISVGDYHLASFVGIALTGSPVDDDGMLELLEPWRGHRQRVVRLLYLSGVTKPRHGPRMSVRDYRAI
ncbi:DNA-3-methyladenine glycosylase family protein [Psychromicrobium lacuslunae]|uniref:DNA-3-methyladenine glycosylase family protein n=1 Tax=Psychromicrobium lacuslunae TaxID=1618207 RepID=UPI001F24AFF8|nr:3-methyladenine DNA glycosylase [Psychromicrobium lacuslunae]